MTTGINVPGNYESARCAVEGTPEQALMPGSSSVVFVEEVTCYLKSEIDLVGGEGVNGEGSNGGEEEPKTRAANGEPKTVPLNSELRLCAFGSNGSDASLSLQVRLCLNADVNEVAYDANNELQEVNCIDPEVVKGETEDLMVANALEGVLCYPEGFGPQEGEENQFGCMEKGESGDLELKIKTCSDNESESAEDDDEVLPCFLEEIPEGMEGPLLLTLKKCEVVDDTGSEEIDLVGGGSNGEGDGEEEEEPETKAANGEPKVVPLNSELKLCAFNSGENNASLSLQVRLCLDASVDMNKVAYDGKDELEEVDCVDPEVVQGETEDLMLADALEGAFCFPENFGPQEGEENQFGCVERGEEGGLELKIKTCSDNESESAEDDDEVLPCFPGEIPEGREGALLLTLKKCEVVDDTGSEEIVEEGEVLAEDGDGGNTEEVDCLVSVVMDGFSMKVSKTRICFVDAAATEGLGEEMEELLCKRRGGRGDESGLMNEARLCLSEVG